MKGKLITDIQKEISNYPSHSAWDKGVRTYAEEIFNNYIESLNDDSIEQITEKDLLNGAEDWQQYSEGGFSLIFDTDICKRLCSPSEQKKTQNGKRKPNSKEDWIDVQARALQQAAAIILSIVNTTSQTKTGLSRMSL